MPCPKPWTGTATSVGMMTGTMTEIVAFVIGIAAIATRQAGGTDPRRFCRVASRIGLVSPSPVRSGFSRVLWSD